MWSRTKQIRKQSSRTVMRPSAGFQTVFPTFQAIKTIFEKSCSTVTRQWLEVMRPSANCQTTFFRRFKQLSNILEIVTERSRDSRRRSSKSEIFWKRSLKGHATVVGGHATVDRLSNILLWTFQQKLRNFEKSRWTVTRQWSEVTRLLADCQTTFFDHSSKLGIFRKKSLKVQTTVVGGHATVGRLSNNFFRRFEQFGNFVKKSLNGYATAIGGHATDGRLSNNYFLTIQAIRKDFEKSRWTVAGQSSEVSRPSAYCQTTFLDVSSNSAISEKSADDRVTSDHCRVTVQWLFSKNFQIAWNVRKTLFDIRPTVTWPPTTVAWPFSDFFPNNSILLETSK